MSREFKSTDVIKVTHGTLKIITEYIVKADDKAELALMKIKELEGEINELKRKRR